jgi:hypothetical protein
VEPVDLSETASVVVEGVLEFPLLAAAPAVSTVQIHRQAAADSVAEVAVNAAAGAAADIPAVEEEDWLHVHAPILQMAVAEAASILAPTNQILPVFKMALVKLQ